MAKITKAAGPSPLPEGNVRSGEGLEPVEEESEGLEHGDAESEATSESDDDRAEYEAETVDQLRAELGRRGLTTTGVKAELVDRLVADDAEYESEERL